ncbi:MAG: uracil-DNA glycosylase [Deltaproteobacteria bacterium]|nr:uracil-DNA glycosylase [Deltaproteobacteria bacterium]
MIEGEYVLADTDEQSRRKRMLSMPHVLPLVHYLEQMRGELGESYETPMFDPCDGGINAKALFLLEAPGRKAVGSGFISRNNPDPSAKKMNRLLHEAGFKREETILWNIVPWYVGTEASIRPVKISDIKVALPYTEKLLGLLKVLKVIILVGLKAQKAGKYISNLTTIPIIPSYHPSLQSVNRYPHRYMDILIKFQEARHIMAKKSR